jgi:hypothetical protein
MGEAKETKAWPRYEAEYLKRALMSERNKYDASGLDAAEKGVYLDRVVDNYKFEADEVLKGEFEEWLQGMHDANLIPEEYLNEDGKPVRRWVHQEHPDAQGGYKVGSARAGWKHTPWGAAPLTHLPGVRDYLRSQRQSAAKSDLEMQMLAEYGPQNLEQSWAYFKHWVKGRPLSDAVALPQIFTEPPERTNFNMQPDSMEDYNPTPTDRQPGVYASDDNAENAAVDARITTEEEQRNYEDAINLRERMQQIFDTGGFGQQADISKPPPEEPVILEIDTLPQEQFDRQLALTGPVTELVPKI